MTTANEYHFVTRWQVDGTCGEVADILGDPLSLPRWWPAVYLHVEELEPAGSNGVGRRVRAVTAGWLPYTLRWEYLTVENRYPFGFSIQAFGDFDGKGVWTFQQNGQHVDITFDWRIRAEKRLIRNLSFLLKPLFESNHRWAMAQGEGCLRLELARRRVPGNGSRSSIPPPPGPVTYAGAALVVGAMAIGAGISYLLIRSRNRRSR